MSRDQLDRLYTPPKVAGLVLAAIADRWSDLLPSRPRLIEPWAGGAAFLEAARIRGWIPAGGCDLDPEAPALGWGGVVLCDSATWAPPAAGLVVSNFPFRLGLGGIQQLLRIGGDAGACLVATLAPERLALPAMAAPFRPSHVLRLSSRPLWQGPGAAAYQRPPTPAQLEAYRLSLQRHEAREEERHRLREAGQRVPPPLRRPWPPRPTQSTDRTDTVLLVWAGPGPHAATSVGRL